MSATKQAAQGSITQAGRPRRPSSPHLVSLTRPADQDQIRITLDRLPHGPAIVTATHDRRPLGFRVHQQSTLSSRRGLVTFAVRRTALTWPQIRPSGRFAINVMPEQSELITRFGQLAIDRFDGVEWTVTATGSPVLSATAWWLDCRLWAEYDGGDHRIVVAQVVDLGEDIGSLPPPFFRRSYPSSARG